MMRRNYSSQGLACFQNSYPGFFIHLFVYSLVITVQMYSGLFAGEPFRFVALMLGWGLGILFHGFNVFVVKNNNLARCLSEIPKDADTRL